MTICSKLTLCKTPNFLGFISVACLFLLTACAGGEKQDTSRQELASRIFKPYRADVVQGNIISKEQMDMVKVGMAKEQIKQILGTPLLTDVFHADRWDYVFAYKRGDNQHFESRVVTLQFKGNVLLKVASEEEVPTEKDLVAEIDQIRKGEKKQKMPASRNGDSNVRMAPTVTNPTSGVGIPPGGAR